MSNPSENCCPKCGAKEISMYSPRTIYSCGSSSYDERPDTFRQSDNCEKICNEADRLIFKFASGRLAGYCLDEIIQSQKKYEDTVYWKDVKRVIIKLSNEK